MIKTRTYVLPTWAIPFEVPKYISRVDCGGDGETGTHGWQVRYWAAPGRFFNDVQNKKRLSPYESLQLATIYLKGFYKGPKPQLRGSKPTLVWKKHWAKNVEQGYIQMHHPQNGKRPIRVYVGTRNTVTEVRIERATVIAKARRVIAEHEHLEFLKTQ